MDVRAQVTPAAGYTPPDDTPKINVGITIFADYSYQDTPTVVDGDKNTIHKNAFNLTRAYINVTGSLSHWFSFRITPDIKAETNSASNLNGNQVVRFKYGYGQVNFDDFAPKGSWLRFGLQQTPWIDYVEGDLSLPLLQGALFIDTEGFLTSSDYGVSGRYALPGNYGDIHVGVYNGDGYQSQNDQSGVNNQKGIQIRGSFRPAPAVPIFKGFRIAGFYDSDHYFCRCQTRALHRQRDLRASLRQRGLRIPRREGSGRP